MLLVMRNVMEAQERWLVVSGLVTVEFRSFLVFVVAITESRNYNQKDESSRENKSSYYNNRRCT